MKQLAFVLFSVSVLGAAGCGDNEGRADAGPRADARRIDASGPDAMVDSSTASTVTVTAGACPNPATFRLTTVAGPQFEEAGGGPANPNITITAGDTVQFNTSGNHNFASAASTPMAFRFRSGAIGPHTACLTFTQSSPNPITYLCEMHPSMTGTLNVNP